MKRSLSFLAVMAISTIMGLSLQAETKTQDNSAQMQNKESQDQEFDSEWLKERVYFNRADWEAQEREIFEEKLKEKRREEGKSELHRKWAIAFAEEWAACSMREKFRTEKGSLAIEKSEKYGKEMKQYWDEIYDKCEKARWRYYRISKALKEKNKTESIKENQNH